MSEQELWDKLYAQMDKGLITYSEMLAEFVERGGKFGMNEGIAR